MPTHLKFRAWDNKEKEWYRESSDDVLTYYGFAIFGECTMIEPMLMTDLCDIEIDQFTGLTDKNDVDIYESDVVYLAGFGKYTVRFPFMGLYEAAMEGDIGAILGNIHQNSELLNE